MPYVAAPELHNVHLPAPVGSHLKVGIAWDGPPVNPRDRGRVFSLGPFVDLFDLQGIAFYGLRRDDAAADDITDAACEALISPIGGRLEDHADTAAVVAQLDLVIAVDGPLVHVAGALARTVWTLLPYAADWRWLSKRDDSPWYPTMRLYRQAEPGDWDGVFGRLRRDLADLIKTARWRCRRPPPPNPRAKRGLQFRRQGEPDAPDNGRNRNCRTDVPAR